MHVLQGRRRGLLVIKGSPGNVPSAVDVEAGTIDAWIIDDESEEKLPFRNDPCRNTVVGYVLGRVDQKNRDAFECTAASTLLLLLLFGPFPAQVIARCRRAHGEKKGEERGKSAFVRVFVSMFIVCMLIGAFWCSQSDAVPDSLQATATASSGAPSILTGSWWTAPGPSSTQRSSR